ncbi:MAG: ATP-binding protein [Syntrophobacteraceae bacterium]|nr:ATP-binding protein [Syntrophobacteraceae bacterium]
MKLRHLYLQNFRCFENLMVQFDPELTVFVSENGMGKTAILDAISYGFGPLFSKLHGLHGGMPTKRADLRIRIMPDNKPSPFLACHLEASDFSGNIVRWSVKRKRDSSKTTLEEMRSAIKESGMDESGLGQIGAYADTLIDRQNRGEPYCMPVIVYYGTSRAVFEVPLALEVSLARREPRKELSRFGGLGDALRPNTRFASVFRWFCAMEDLERRERQRRRDFEYTLPELNAVRDSIESMLPGFKDPRTEVEPLRNRTD